MLIESDNIRQSFEVYRAEMTTQRGFSFEDTSPYYFWKKRFSEVMEPILVSSDGKKQDSDILLKLCVSSLFGDSSTISFDEDLDLVSTGLVMVNLQSKSWRATMAEPIVLSAGLNFLGSNSPDAVMDHFAGKIFAPLRPPFLSPQERGHLMELVIALRFVQGWWHEPDLQAFLPKWVNAMSIPKPLGIMDCREESNANMFLQQLRNASFPYVLLPAADAGPDLRYSVFSCCHKTTFTYASAEEAEKNLAIIDPVNWYKSQARLQTECSKELQNNRFVHMRFELPDTAPSMKDDFKSGEVGTDFVICVNLESEFALKFFGRKFVDTYEEFVRNVITNQ